MSTEDHPISHNIFELAAPDIQWYLERSDVILVPTASMENHGAHIPIGCDSIACWDITTRSARKADVPHTPVLWTGYSPHHMKSPNHGWGTVTLRPSTYLDLLYDVGRSLIHHGWNKIIFVDGHGSNLKIIDPVMRKLRYDTGALILVYKPFAERYYGILKDLFTSPPEDTPGWHSAELETSQMLAARPELVRMERAVKERVHTPPHLPAAFTKRDGAADLIFQGYEYFMTPMEHNEFSDSATIGDPFTGTAEKGERQAEIFSDYLRDAIDELRKVEVKVHHREFVEKCDW